jgi:hypothetical protein
LYPSFEPSESIDHVFEGRVVVVEPGVDFLAHLRQRCGGSVEVLGRIWPRNRSAGHLNRHRPSLPGEPQ